jgi:hypothetical protein
LITLLLALLIASGGCGDRLSTSYGPSTGFLAKRSINGFTTFRDAFRSAGFSQRDFNRLTERARQVSVVVWTPTDATGIEADTTRWFDRWLRMGGKTLIFVIPDSGSETEYYREARPLADPAQRLEYRRKYAESLINDHQWQLNRTPLPSNGWFTASPKVQRSSAKATPELGEVAANRLSDSEGVQQRRFEWMLQPFERADPAQPGTTNWQPAGPGSRPWSGGQTSSNGRAISPTTTEVEFHPVLQTDQGDTVVALVTSDTWRSSQVVVVAGGSLLTNFGLIRAENQRLADHLIESSLETLVADNVIDPEMRLTADGSEPVVGFSTANGGLPISERSVAIPRASGAELLTVFPISLVTIHIAVLGFVICLMLMPVFGRPRRIDRGVLTHFGDHLDAVATLMRRRGGEAFAKRRISDYMKHVRGETAGPWVLDDPVHPPASPPTTPETPSVDSRVPLSPVAPPVQTTTRIKQAPPIRSDEDSNPLDRG